MFRTVLFVSICTLFLACGRSNESIPKHILSQDKMAEIIKDIQLLEAVHKDIAVFGMEKQQMRDTSYMIVFNKHQVKAADFDSSYRYYTAKPILFEEILEKVEYQLTKENL